jgi:hypothetical protein
MDTPSSELRDFILFCAQRRSAEWPMIYDEMARVAGQRLFRGLGYSELRQMGLSLSLSGMDKTIQLVKQVTSGDDRQAADSLQGFPATSGPHPGSKQSVRVTSGKQ